MKKDILQEGAPLSLDPLARAGRFPWAGLLSPRWRLASSFRAGAYLAANPDLGQLRLPLALHWLRHGRYEERWPCQIAAVEHERALWSGETEARAALRGGAQSAQDAERIWSRLALARACAAEGDWQGAAAEMAHLSMTRDLVQALGMPTPLLFAIELALRGEDLPRAEQGLALYRAAFGTQSGGLLMEAALARQTQGDAGWNAVQNRLYSAHSLVSAQLTGPDDRPAFDRLRAQAARVQDGPLVTVILAVRNAQTTIDTALRGLVMQSWRNLEILVIDNGSQDGTALRLRDWAAQDSRIRLIDGHAEPGAYAARNLALEMAKGEMVTLQDADDWAHPDRIRLQAEALAASGGAANLSHWLRVTEDLTPSLLRPGTGLLHPNLSSILMRRAAFTKAGFWDRVRAAADTEYIARLRQIFGPSSVAHVYPQIPLAFGRLAEGSLTLSPATGLFGPGASARMAYKAAAQLWHAQGGGALYLPRLPETRPFPAPAALVPEPRI